MVSPPRSLSRGIRPLTCGVIWSGRRDSNPRPSPWQDGGADFIHYKDVCFAGQERCLVRCCLRRSVVLPCNVEQLLTNGVKKVLPDMSIGVREKAKFPSSP